LAYDSAYKRDKQENIKDDKKEEKVPENADLGGPLTFWIGILVLATLLQLIAIPIANYSGHTAFNSYLNEFADYAIYIPGILVLPLIVSVWIGERVSYLSKKSSSIAYKGIINSLYSSMIYIVSITIIYIIMVVQKAGVIWSLSPEIFAERLILIPVLISIILVPLFAILSAARRNN
jgi:hypothetical protein